MTTSTRTNEIAQTQERYWRRRRCYSTPERRCLDFSTYRLVAFVCSPCEFARARRCFFSLARSLSLFLSLTPLSSPSFYLVQQSEEPRANNAVPPRAKQCKSRRERNARRHTGELVSPPHLRYIHIHVYYARTHVCICTYTHALSLSLLPPPPNVHLFARTIHALTRGHTNEESERGEKRDKRKEGKAKRKRKSVRLSNVPRRHDSSDTRFLLLTLCTRHARLLTHSFSLYPSTSLPTLL